MRSIPFPPANLLRHSCGRPEHLLSLRAHTSPMDLTKPQKVVLLIIALVTIGAWALIIFVATVVTRTALESLAYIVELAQFTP